MLDILPWFAIGILSYGYFQQAWRIHVHKEVRDLSIKGYVALAVGFIIMLIVAIKDGSTIFAVKQLATLIPCCIIIYQIIVHRDDKWED